ncbi:MAG: GNAT family N-acetyltransferase [Mycobacteriales bacterium]
MTTDRLALERVGVARARAIVAGDYSGVRRGRGWPHADTVDGLRAFDVDAAADDETGWLVTLRESGEVIGDCGWKGAADGARSVEIGYGIAAPYRGRGYATEAVGALVEWTLAQPGVTVVVAEVEATNIASRRLLERLGFAVQNTAGAFVYYARSA